jgi:hypothetical protein
MHDDRDTHPLCVSRFTVHYHDVDPDEFLDILGS